MQIDWPHFTPVAALAGGALIGAAAALLALSSGRVLGAIGIFGGAIERGGADRAWRWSALVGLFLAPLLAHVLWGAGPPQFQATPFVVVAAGVLVGFGARLANGCTSGHGVCGLARLSPRSLAATLTFMAMGIATVFVARHLFG